MKLPPATGWILGGALVGILLYGTWRPLHEMDDPADRAPPAQGAAPANWPRSARDGIVVPLKMRRVSREESPCRLGAEATLAIVCNGRAFSLKPDIRYSGTSEEWQTATRWREGAGSGFIIDSPAGEFWCGYLQAYTGRNNQRLDWVDAILVAPLAAKPRGGAFWGINNERQVRCEDLWWWSQTQPRIALYLGLENGTEKWQPVPASVSDGLDR